MLYNNLSSYLRKKYGGKVKKICIDGGFSCPNRDGTCGRGGCIFCGERGAGEHIRENLSIEKQVSSVLEHAADDEKFIAYFQNFTNTYAPLEALRQRYDAALIDRRIVALAIGTRPDCIDDDIAKLIASYRDRCDIWVELGLQSSSNKTAKLINRGYESSVFSEACKILSKYSIPVVVHAMLGLPGEGLREISDTVSFITRHEIWGIKLHGVYVMEGTKLADMYRAGEYTPPSLDEYTDYVIFALEHLPPDTVIHRLASDCPRSMLVAPEWNSDKNRVLNEIKRKLDARGSRQGTKYK